MGNRNAVGLAAKRGFGKEIVDAQLDGHRLAKTGARVGFAEVHSDRLCYGQARFEPA